MEVRKVTDFLHFKKAEKYPKFVYPRKNPVSDEKLEELNKTYVTFMVQFEQLGNEVKKTIDKDLDHFRSKKIAANFIEAFLWYSNFCLNFHHTIEHISLHLNIV